VPYPFVNEPARLQALHELKILDTPSEPAFDRLVQAAKNLFDVPYALITFVDADRAWIKTGWGVDFCEADRDHAICNYTILHDTVLVVPDTLRSKEFRGNPYVQGEPHLRFYAGAPLTLAPNVRVGALCLLDTKPRTFDAAQMQDLNGLARLVVDELWLRQTLRSKGGISRFMAEGDATGLSFSEASHLSGMQVRAARALLDWTIMDLAKAAQVSVNTIKRLEDRQSENSPRASCNERIRLTFEAAGVVFFDRTGVALLPK
jgi:GAF domain-containing protein